MATGRKPLPPQNTAFNRAGGPAAFAEGGIVMRGKGRSSASTSSSSHFRASSTPTPSSSSSSSSSVPASRILSTTNKFAALESITNLTHSLSSSSSTPKTHEAAFVGSTSSTTTTFTSPPRGVHPSRMGSVPGALLSSPLDTNNTIQNAPTPNPSPAKNDSPTTVHLDLTKANPLARAPSPAVEKSPWTPYLKDDPRQDETRVQAPVMHGHTGWASGTSSFSAKQKFAPPPAVVKGWGDLPKAPPKLAENSPSPTTSSSVIKSGTPPGITRIPPRPSILSSTAPASIAAVIMDANSAAASQASPNPSLSSTSNLFSNNSTSLNPTFPPGIPLPAPFGTSSNASTPIPVAAKSESTTVYMSQGSFFSHSTALPSHNIMGASTRNNASTSQSTLSSGPPPGIVPPSLALAHLTLSKPPGISGPHSAGLVNGTSSAIFTSSSAVHIDSEGLSDVEDDDEMSRKLKSEVAGLKEEVESFQKFTTRLRNSKSQTPWPFSKPSRRNFPATSSRDASKRRKTSKKIMRES
ncbi:hypothetical protein T439DRAFT_117224 [Meredithblackwellia eburnea MCA 4105]